MNNIGYQNNISFNGHCGCEYLKYGKSKIMLTTETAFGREFEKLDKAVKDVNKRFKDVKVKRIVVGACSTGEQVWSYKMLMGDNPVEILGFDVSPNVLKIAKSATYELFPKDSKMVKLYGDSDGYQDIFLAYDKPNKTVQETRLYKMFHKMFEEVEFKTWNPFKEARKIFKLRKEQPDCKFINADIRKLPPEITDGEKCHIFSFTNSFYHIITFHNGVTDEARDPRKVRPLLDKIFKDVNKSVQKGGLFIMGKNECYQCPNIKLVTKALLNNGFRPRVHNEKFCDVWEKTSEI